MHTMPLRVRHGVHSPGSISHRHSLFPFLLVIQTFRFTRVRCTLVPARPVMAERFAAPAARTGDHREVTLPVLRRGRVASAVLSRT